MEKTEKNNENIVERMGEMKKTLKIEGMMCNNCKMHVEKALNALDGVKAVVDLGKKSAEISSTKEISNEILTETVKEAGYEVTAIEE